MKREQTFVGIGTSTGIVVGPALVYFPALWAQRHEPTRQPTFHASSAHTEIKRLYDAIAVADETLAETEAHLRTEGRTAEAHIFEAHRSLLKKPALRKHAVSLISRAGWCAADAIVEAGKYETNPYLKTRDPYLSAYISDIHDVVEQIRRILENDKILADRLTSPAIVVAKMWG